MTTVIARIIPASTLLSKYAPVTQGRESPVYGSPGGSQSQIVRKLCCISKYALMPDKKKGVTRARATIISAGEPIAANKYWSRHWLYLYIK